MYRRAALAGLMPDAPPKGKIQSPAQRRRAHYLSFTFH
jgi:hypothetical protein